MGKTTTSVNLAASLAFLGKRTLLVDLDSVGSSGLSLGFTEVNARAGVYDLFNGNKGIHETIHKTELKNLDLIPAHVSTLQMEERLARLADNRSILRNFLRTIGREYDYFILDCPPALRGLTTNALVASDGIIIPVKCGNFSLDALEKLFRHIDWLGEVTHDPRKIEGIVLTMVEPNTRVTDLTISQLQFKYGKYLFETSIPQNSTLSEASFYGKPAILYGVGCKGASAYLALANELIARQEGKNSATQPAVNSPLHLVDRRAGGEA